MVATLELSPRGVRTINTPIGNRVYCRASGKRIRKVEHNMRKQYDVANSRGLALRP